MSKNEFILEQLLDVSHLPVLLGVDGIEVIQRSTDKIIKTFQNQHRLVLWGAGHCQIIADHLASEFKSGLIMKRPSLPVYSIKTDFIIQNKINLEEYIKPGDCLLLIADTGENIGESLASQLNKLDISIIILCGFPKPKNISPDILFYIPLINRTRLEEVFLITGHILCTVVESVLFSDGNSF